METQELLREAANEIRVLRRKNEIMSARLDMFDAVVAVLHSEPARRSGVAMHPDVLCELEKAIEVEKSKS